ncbi:hypothetical protein [Clostridium ganghwense]|uniref:Cell division protein FtsL n=1 Tax=Clostridium ganghwense TaxID=312089 RepID=A0ABT4CMS8_9CLOT|nr:hypothetical protein [Clostridium ganghwense]MCY6370359.1 hypothetical protein [Clostridium ganghwense]
MIVTNKKNAVSGSNALAPDYAPSRGVDEQKHKELEKSKKEHIKINKQKQIKKKAKVLRNIILAFGVGVTLVYRYCLIYNMEKNITEVKKQIAVVNADNENLKIGLLKYNNIEQIEKKATEQLNMIPRSRANAVQVDLGRNNFKKTHENGVKKSNSFIEKIKKILF